jgi:hypothetical protein
MSKAVVNYYFVYKEVKVSIFSITGQIIILSDRYIVPTASPTYMHQPGGLENVEKN